MSKGLLVARFRVHQQPGDAERRKADGYHLIVEEMPDAVDERYAVALRLASLEAGEGRYDPPELAEMVDEEQVKAQALQLIVEAQ